MNSPQDRRANPRADAAGKTTIRLKGLEIPAELADVSPGGCKLRINTDILHLIEKVIPVDVVLEFPGMQLDATAVWSRGGLLGFQFAHPLSLADVGAVMATKHRSH